MFLHFSKFCGCRNCLSSCSTHTVRIDLRLLASTAQIAPLRGAICHDQTITVQRRTAAAVQYRTQRSAVQHRTGVQLSTATQHQRHEIVKMSSCSNVFVHLYGQGTKEILLTDGQKYVTQDLA